MSDRLFSKIAVSASILIFMPVCLQAGGPKYIAGASFFNPGVMGQPVHWAGGQVDYYVDQGPLTAAINNEQATAMVDAAASLWSAVPTAGIILVRQGSLGEDVSGANIVPGNQSIGQPSDASPSATTLPLAIVYDADGSVLDTIFGAYTSDPSNCQNNGVMAWIDNFNPDATIAHAVMALNGRCATTPNLVSMMQFQLERAFGRILGLGYAQVNPGALRNGDLESAEGWPVMQPMAGSCGPSGGICIPDPSTLRFDDIAALNRIYPITANNLAAFPGKVLTAANTVSIDGTIAFRTGLGMQGVNVVARPLDADGNPLDQYAVTSVSGIYFNGNHGNRVTGFTDANGNPLSQWGSNDASLQGYFDLRFMPLPPGATAAAWRITFESINSLYTYAYTVGPYTQGSPQPSGTLSPISVPALTAGMTQTLTVTIPDSAAVANNNAISTEAAPRMLPPSGLWCGRLSQVGQTDWFNFPIRGNRTFTIVTEALDEAGRPSNFKAMPVLGIWDAFAPLGVSPVGAAPGLNGNSTGESWLQVTSSGDDMVRLGIADMRGDGRPDYAYNGWVLYADTVLPQRLPVTGGPIVIRGMGFHLADTVLVGGQPAQITSISPNEITAIAPPAAAGITGSVDVEVDDLPIYFAAAIIGGGISYDAGTGDALNLVTAPANTVPIGVPLPFAVKALGGSLDRAGGVTVTYRVASGTASLGCGKTTCPVMTSGDGAASMNVTAVDGTASVVTASLANGSSLQAHFSGGTPPALTALTPALSLAAGATISWTTQALVLNNGAPISGQAVVWQSASSAITSFANTAALSSSAGIASKTLSVGPLGEGQQSAATACLNGTSQCVTFQAVGARPEYALLQSVGGTRQTLAASGTPGVVTLRLLDMNGNAMAGGTVTFYQALYAWSPPCPAHGRCVEPQLLATQTSVATSAIDGTVTFAPISMPGVPTKLVGLAATGNTSTLGIAIEQHP